MRESDAERFEHIYRVEKLGMGLAYVLLQCLLYTYRVCGEKNEVVGEDGTPNYADDLCLVSTFVPNEQLGAYNPDACLRNNTGAWRIQRSA